MKKKTKEKLHNETSSHQKHLLIGHQKHPTGAIRELESRHGYLRQPINPGQYGQWNGIWTPNLIMTIMEMYEDGVSSVEQMAETSRRMGGPDDVRSMGWLYGRLSAGFGGGFGGGWGGGGGGGGGRRRRRRGPGGGGGVPLPFDAERPGRSRSYGHLGPSDSPFGPGMPGMPRSRDMPSGRQPRSGLPMPQGMPGMPGMPGMSRRPMDPRALPPGRSHRSGIPGMPPGMPGMPRMPEMPRMPGRSRMPPGMSSYRHGPPPPFDGHSSRRRDRHGPQSDMADLASEFMHSFLDDSDSDDIFESPEGGMGSGMPPDMPFGMGSGMGSRRRRGQAPGGRWTSSAVEVEEVGDDEGSEPDIFDVDG